MTNGLLSPIDGRPLDARWQADLKAGLRKCYNPIDGKDKAPMRAMRGVSSRPFADVGNTGNPRGKISRRQLIHNINVFRRALSTRLKLIEGSHHPIPQAAAKALIAAKNKVLPMWRILPQTDTTYRSN